MDFLDWKILRVLHCLHLSEASFSPQLLADSFVLKYFSLRLILDSFCDSVLCFGSGLRDNTGALYSPSIVRVGLNAHHSIASVAMDSLVGKTIPSESLFTKQGIEDKKT